MTETIVPTSIDRATTGAFLACDLPLEDIVPTRKVGRFHHGDLRLSLLAAAARALATRGDADISLRELARGLGVTHAAAYRHFSAKSDLLAALAARGWARLAELTDRVVTEAAGEASVETLRRIGHAYIAFARVNPGPYHAMQLRELRHHGFAALDAAVETVIDRLVALIRDGQATGALRGDIAPRDLAVAVLAALDGAARAVLMAPDPAEIAAHVVDMAASGLGTLSASAGHRLTPLAGSATSTSERRERRKAPVDTLTLELFD